MCGFSVQTVAIGVVSVMPQGWMTRTPNLSKRRNSVSGAADPATTMRRPFSSRQRSGSLSSASRTPSQIVGTPPVSVT